MGLYDKKNNILTFNIAQVAVEWIASEPGEWNFKNTQNPVLFRSTAEDGLDTKENLEKNCSFIFELVVYLKYEDPNDKSRVDIKQYSCGWAEAPLASAKRTFTQSFEIIGGSPLQ